MKKALLLFIVLFAMPIMAQNQQAIVKTRGKLDDKGNLIPGRGLSGAFVKIKDGNVHESKKEGKFSFPVPGGIYHIESVSYVDPESKERYQLVDMDELNRNNKYSTVPKDILVAGYLELSEDRLNEEERARELLKERYRAREEEIKRLQADNKISRDEIIRLRQQLSEARANEEKIVMDIVDRYTRIDFDRMTDFDLHFAHFIRSGQLKCADSLLRTRGDLFAMEDTLRMIRASNAEGRKIIAAKEEELRRDKEQQIENEILEKAYLDKTADICFKRYEIFDLEFNLDSAVYYLERRALLDTTNAEWISDVGKYYHNLNHFQKAEASYLKALNIYRQTNENKSQEDACFASILSALGILCYQTHRYTESEALLNESLEIYRRLADDNPIVFDNSVASLLDNLALLYRDVQQISLSESMHKDALEIKRKLANIDPQAYNADLALGLHNLASFYYSTLKFEESEKLIKEAVQILRGVAETNPRLYKRQLASSLNLMGTLYSNMQRYHESEALYKEALDIKRRLAVNAPMVHEPGLSLYIYNLAVLYSKITLYNKSETLHKEAIEIRRRLVQNNPEVFDVELAASLRNLATVYKETLRFAESEMTLLEAIDIQRKVARSNPQVHNPTLALYLNDLGCLYDKELRLKESEIIFKEAVEIQREFAEINPDVHGALFYRYLINLSTTYSKNQKHEEQNNILNEAADILNKVPAVDVISQSQIHTAVNSLKTEGAKLYQMKLYLDKISAQKDPETFDPKVAKDLVKLAEYYADSNSYDESKKLYEEALEIYRKLLKVYSDRYESEFAATSYGLGVLLIKTSEYDYAIQSMKDALTIYRKLKNKHRFQYEGTLFHLRILYAQINDFTNAYNICEEFLPLLKKDYKKDPEKYRYDYAACLGDQSFFCLLVTKFAEAERYALNALKIDTTMTYVYSNLAPALLFQGKYEKAKGIYLNHKDNLKDSFLGDFDVFEKAKIIPVEYQEDVVKIKQFINEK